MKKYRIIYRERGYTLSIDDRPLSLILTDECGNKLLYRLSHDTEEMMIAVFGRHILFTREERIIEDFLDSIVEILQGGEIVQEVEIK